MSTHGEIKREIFKSVLRRYFFNNEQTMAALAGIDNKTLMQDERIQAIVNNSKNKRIVDDLAEATREAVFNAFYNRMISGVLLNEKGEPYRLPAGSSGRPVLSDELIDDFMAGKPIAFMGAGNDHMTSISADKDELNQLLVDVNSRGRGDKDFVPKIFEKQTGSGDRTEHVVNFGDWDMEASLSRTYGTAPASSEPPKSNIFQNWANSIKKLFTGRPTARWAPYEKYQKMQELQTAIEQADRYKGLANELDPKNLDASIRSVGDEQWKRAVDGILKKQKEKAAEEQAEKQRAAEEQAEKQKTEEAVIAAPQEPVTEEQIIEDLHLQSMSEETEEEKQASEELREEDRKKLAESDVRRKSIEDYRKAFVGKTMFGGDAQSINYIANEAHFMSVFAPGTYRKNAVPEANKVLDPCLLKLDRYAYEGNIPFDDIEKLPELLADVYLLGKLKAGYPDRENMRPEDIKLYDYDTVAEYNQILERYDLIKKNLTTVFAKSDIPARILADPSGEINKHVLNPDVLFCQTVDRQLVRQGVYEAVSNKIKGIESMPDLSAARSEEPQTVKKTGPVRNI